MNDTAAATKARDALPGTSNVPGLLEGIARRILNIDTLQTRNSDDLDFHNLAVWSIREALRVAYDSGYGHAIEQTQSDR